LARIAWSGVSCSPTSVDGSSSPRSNISRLGVETARDLVLRVDDEGGTSCATSSLLLFAEVFAEVFASIAAGAGGGGVVAFCGDLALACGVPPLRVILCAGATAPGNGDPKSTSNSRRLGAASAECNTQ
jgi:hypothetical protein